MTSDEFLAWAINLPEGERYELLEGELLPMPPERSIHALTRARVWRALEDALAVARIEGQALPDGMAVEVAPGTVYEPDALVRCGPPLADDTIKITDTVIVVEVVSPSAHARDAGLKLIEYARIASLRHYLLVETRTKSVVAHRLEPGREITTRIVRDGPLILDPPGLELDVRSLFS
jgi:Uma2 family endonuclease